MEVHDCSNSHGISKVRSAWKWPKALSHIISINMPSRPSPAHFNRSQPIIPFRHMTLPSSQNFKRQPANLAEKTISAIDVREQSSVEQKSKIEPRRRRPILRLTEFLQTVPCYHVTCNWALRSWWWMLHCLLKLTI